MLLLNVPVILLESLIFPFFMGTLKSARRSTYELELRCCTSCLSPALANILQVLIEYLNIKQSNKFWNFQYFSSLFNIIFYRIIPIIFFIFLRSYALEVYMNFINNLILAGWFLLFEH